MSAVAQTSRLASKGQGGALERTDTTFPHRKESRVTQSRDKVWPGASTDPVFDLSLDELSHASVMGRARVADLSNLVYFQ